LDEKIAKIDFILFQIKFDRNKSSQKDFFRKNHH